MPAPPNASAMALWTADLSVGSTTFRNSSRLRQFGALTPRHCQLGGIDHCMAQDRASTDQCDNPAASTSNGIFKPCRSDSFMRLHQTTQTASTTNDNELP
ncbi:hypothetical protein AYK87_06325 [Stutzerimonas stutzeri]|nr:hypothetical protein AYK87_06325 [Stutzerimonas stutzeri]